MIARLLSQSIEDSARVDSKIAEARETILAALLQRIQQRALRTPQVFIAELESLAGRFLGGSSAQSTDAPAPAPNLLQVLEQTLQTLREPQRTVLRELYLHRRQPGDVARKLSLSIAQLRTLQWSAVGALREGMGLAACSNTPNTQST